MTEFDTKELAAIRHGDWGTLRRADLRHANLRHANLRDADLRDADLRHADLRHADLRHANLRDADLRDANLRDADLRHADLRDAGLRDADLSPHMVVPEEGTVTVWKACKNHIVKCNVPAGAERITALGSRKCRSSMLDVLDVRAPDGTPSDDTEAIGRHDAATRYVEGERVHPDEFDDDIRVECSYGLHFFITREEAAAWGGWGLADDGGVNDG